jgi:hypothetical protein
VWAGNGRGPIGRVCWGLGEKGECDRWVTYRWQCKLGRANGHEVQPPPAHDKSRNSSTHIHLHAHSPHCKLPHGRVTCGGLA